MEFFGSAPADLFAVLLRPRARDASLVRVPCHPNRTGGNEELARFNK